MMDLNSSRNSTKKITGKCENSQNNTVDLRNGVNMFKGNGILNNNHHYNKIVAGSKFSDGDKNSTINPESKFSPRVKQGIELKILKPAIYSDVKSVTQSYLRSRGSTPSPLATSSAKEQDSDSSSSTLESLQSGNTTSDSGKSVIQKKVGNKKLTDVYLKKYVFYFGFIPFFCDQSRTFL